jgi:hypothetical protein
MFDSGALFHLYVYISLYYTKSLKMNKRNLSKKRIKTYRQKDKATKKQRQKKYVQRFDIRKTIQKSASIPSSRIYPNMDWMEIEIPMIKHSTWCQKQLRENGGGNFLNPKTVDECFIPLTNTNFKFVDMDESMLENLLHHVIIKKSYFAKGTYNRVSSAQGTSICTSSVHKLVYRESVKPIHITTSLIKQYRKEMEIMASLHGIMPTLYMCGYIYMEDNIHGKFFSIMEKIDTTLQIYLTNINDVEKITQILRMVMEMYQKVAEQGYCIIDVKPGNIVINYKPLRVYLIDVDPIFDITNNVDTYLTNTQTNGNEDIKNIHNSMYYLMMVYIFLHTTYNFALPQYPYIIDEQLETLKSNPYYDIFIQFFLTEYNKPQDQISNYQTYFFKKTCDKYKIPLPRRNTFHLSNKHNSKSPTSISSSSNIHQYFTPPEQHSSKP